MFRDNRWFVVESVLTDSTLEQNYWQLIALLRFYRVKYKYDKATEHYKVPREDKDKELANKMLDWVADYMPFESYKSDVIKNELWVLLGL